MQGYQLVHRVGDELRLGRVHELGPPGVERLSRFQELPQWDVR